MPVAEPSDEEYPDFALSYTIGPRGGWAHGTATWTNSLDLVLKAAKLSRTRHPRAKVAVFVRASKADYDENQ
jgi:hypothetical protein